MVSGFEISDRLKMLGDKQRKDKERIKKLKQKLLKKGRTYHCGDFEFSEINFLRVFVNRQS